MSASRATNGATDCDERKLLLDPQRARREVRERLVLKPEDLDVAGEADDLFGDLPLEAAEDGERDDERRGAEHDAQHGDRGDERKEAVVAAGPEVPSRDE